MACKAGQECCYMKGASGTPEKSSVAGIVSATVTKAAQPMLPPPLGLRSAVPLGGVGAGALELRGDGSIHEVTIQNQSPGGAAKYGTFSDALLAVRIGAGAAPAAVRTRPPPGIPGVAGITYSGAYPVSRLTVDDPTVGPAGSNPTVYAYSHLAAGDKVASGKPAVAFTLSLSNPSATEALPVSFALSLPLAGVNDCARNSRVAPVATTQAPSAAACLQACAGNPQCASWTWRGQGPSAGTCTLNGDVPWSVHEEGASCGIAGSWLSASPVALTFSAYPAGLEGNASDSNPGAGDLTLAAVVDPASTTFTNLSVTAGVGDNVTSAWASVFGSSSGAASGADAVPPSGTHGMLSVSGSLPPGSSGTLSIVLAWYFPDRDHVGFDVGNFYSTLYRDSLDVASQLTTSGALASAVSDIAALHSVFTASTLPSWLVDHSINSFSHMRTVIWTRDGRWRQWEAPDCPDVDSIHNDYQRHLPYLWLFPENEVQKMEKWASGQVTEPGNGEFGLIYEYLGAFSLGPLDVPGGRVMADTTSLWVVEALELWRNTGDGDLLQRFYPTVARALTWQVNRARRAGVGIPDHLVNTYDITNPQEYNATMFNAAVYLTSLQAGAALADAVGDAATATLARTAYAQGVNATLALLWNATAGYFTAFTGVPGSVHADCLYGQMLSLYLSAPGDAPAWHFPASSVSSHLATEQARNGNPFGFTVVTGRSPTPTPSPASALASAHLGPRAQAAISAAAQHSPLGAHELDTTNWMGAAPTWSALQIALGNLSIDEALAPTQRELDNFRTRLNDFWSITGLVSGVWGEDGVNGQPHTTSHYGFHMPFYYLLPALAGQRTDLPAGALTFAPPGVPAGQAFTLPFFLAGAGGTIARDAAGGLSLDLHFGALTLPAGGLAVAGVPYPRALTLVAGGSVSWSS